jgi:hypothetical protein
MLKNLLKRLLLKPSTSPLTFHDNLIFYNYVFDLSKNVVPIEIARQILKTNYAIALSNYASDSVELSDVFRSSLSLREQAFHIAELSESLEQKGLRGAAAWMIRHPKVTFRALLMLRRARKEENSNNQSEIKEEESDQATADALKAVISELDDEMVQTQILCSLHKFSDEQLFSEIYLDDMPFVRLELQAVTATFDERERSIDVGLLIHRTGVAILTFYVMLPEHRAVDDLIKLKSLKSIAVTNVKVPEALMGTAAIATGLAKPSSIKDLLERQTKAGERECVQILGEEPGYTLRDVFDWYRMTILSTVLGHEPVKPDEFWDRLRSPDWHAYPIFFIRGVLPELKTADIFKRKYSAELAGVLGGSEGWKDFNKHTIEKIIKDDHSLTKDVSFYVGLSHTVVIYYDSYKRKLQNKLGQKDIPGQEWLFEHLQRSGLVDVLLIQDWILHILNRELRFLSFDLGDLNNLKRNLLLALDEYHEIGVTSGTAREIIRSGQAALRINETYESIKAQLSTVEKLIDVEESIRRYRRDLYLRWVATAATLLFGLQGARQVVGVLSSWRVPLWTKNLWPLGELISDTLTIIRSHPNYSTGIFYILLILTILPALLLSVWQRRPRKTIVSFDQSDAARLPGFTWPVDLKVQRGEKLDVG